MVPSWGYNSRPPLKGEEKEREGKGREEGGKREEKGRGGRWG
jgi:hypothetical protein